MFEAMLGSMGMGNMGGKATGSGATQTGNTTTAGAGGITMGSPVTITAGGGSAWLLLALLAAVLIRKG